MGSFDHRDIRRGMDVYTADGRWLGSVLRVRAGVDGDVGAPITTYPLSSNDGNVSFGGLDSRTFFSGEWSGPGSTTGIGNLAPRRQSQTTLFATVGDGSTRLDGGWLEVGRWPGIIGVRRVPVGDVLGVSFERVVILEGSDQQ